MNELFENTTTYPNYYFKTKRISPYKQKKNFSNPTFKMFAKSLPGTSLANVSIE
jgi:hypothetical protein